MTVMTTMTVMTIITIMTIRAQKKLHPYHPGWKTIPNLGDNFVLQQRKNRQKDSQTYKQFNKQTDRGPEQDTYRQTIMKTIKIDK